MDRLGGSERELIAMPRAADTLMISVPGIGEVSGILNCPSDSRWLYVLGHGAGAGMRHAFLERVSADLGARGIATLRYQFPYMERGKRPPDRPPTARATVRAAVETVRGLGIDLPIVAGGKSFGGRMTSQAQAEKPLAGVRGLVFLGFPLHAPNRLSDERAAHLSSVDVPMLFMQGTRDSLADLELMRSICTGLGPRVTLHIVDGGDHSFQVLKRSGRTEDEVMVELCDTIDTWCTQL